MPAEDELSLVVRLQDQASATLKALGTTLEGLAKSAGTATDALNKQTAATDQVGKAADALSAKTKFLDTLHGQFSDTLRGAQKQMTGYAEQTGRAGEFLTKMGVAGIAAAAAVGLVIEKGREGVEAWAAWEKQALRFDAAMKATGQGAKASFAQLNQEAREISRGTIFDVDATTQAMARLARSGVLTMSKVRELTPKVLDIAASTGRSTTDVAGETVRLFQNPERAIAMMARTNPAMTPTDMRRLEERVRSGQGEGVADDVMKRLANPAAGQATAMTAGVAGAYAELKKNMAEWTEASSRSFGKMIADALHLEDALHAVAKASETGKEASQNRFRALTAATPEDRIAGAQQRIRDIQANSLQGLPGVDLGEGGIGASMAGGQVEALIAEQQKIIAESEELMREREKQGHASDGAVQRKIDARTYSNAAEVLNQADQMSAKQKELNQQITAYENGLAAVERAAPGAFDAGEVERMRGALIKTKNELDNLKDGFDAVRAAIPGEVYAAGLSPSQAAFNGEYSKLAAKVGEKYHLTADQLSVDDATRAANPNSMAPDKFKEIMDELMSMTISKLAQLGDAQFARDQTARSQEMGMVLRAMQPGAAGQRASAELEAYRNTKGIYGAAQRGQAYSAELNSKLAQDQYKAQIEMQQQLQKFGLQADQARLQGALLTGGSAVIGGGTFDAGGSANASTIASILRGKYGASDTAIAAVLGHFQQESGLDPTKEHLDSNGFVSKGLGQWQKSRAAGLEAFAGVGSGGQASIEQQLDFMMKEIRDNPAFRAMWARMNAGGTSLDAATDAFGSYEGYGDNSGAARRANARKFMPGATLTYTAGGAMGEDVARRQAALLPQAQEFAQRFGIPLDDALRTLMGADRQALGAENATQLTSMNNANRSGAALNAAQMAGGVMGRQRAQWGLDAFSKGFTGQQGDAYLAAQQGSLDNANTKTLLDKLAAQRESNELTLKEADLASASTETRQRELDLFKLSQEAKRQGYDVDSLAYKQQVEAINQAADAAEKLRRAQGPFGTWLADTKDDWKTWEDAAVSAIGTAESGFANMLTGTTSLKDGLASLTKSFADMAANAAFKSIFGSIANYGMGMLEGLGSGGATGATGAVAAADGIHDTAFASHAFANGGIMSQYGSLPLRRYATGGIATSPQLALFGEGAHNEAYVPLPDGRSIPVTMAGGGGGGNSNVLAPNITVNVPQGAAGQPGQASGMDPKALGDMVGAAIHAKMTEFVTNEARPGGALNPVYG